MNPAPETEPLKHPEHSTSTSLQEAEELFARQKSEFLATLAHELRNPLAPIRNALHLLRLADTEQAHVRLHDILDHQLVQLIRLVDDLLEISRITTGKIELHTELVDLGDLIKQAVAMHRGSIEAEWQQLTVVVPSEPLMVEGDRARLTQLISNLLNNASRYTLSGGHIEVRAWHEEDDVCVAVADDGLGIPVEMLPVVFEMFSPGEHVRRRPEDGLGVGLALSRELAELHGGRIEVFSAGLNQGSEFVVRLPRSARADATQEDPFPRPRGAPAPASRRILVVDDNRDGADSLGMVLKMMGADTLVAYDGASALKHIRENHPYAVLLDIGMPDMDGFQVAATVRTDPEIKHTRLIALTGWGSAEMRARSEAAGFDDHWVKPVDPEWLRELSRTPTQEMM